MSLLALYGLGGYLVSHGLLPLRTLLSAVGFTFALVFSSQGAVQSLADSRRAVSAVQRCGTGRFMSVTGRCIGVDLWRLCWPAAGMNRGRTLVSGNALARSLLHGGK